MELTEEQIEKAVVWWADRVAQPVFSGLSPEERKDPRNSGYQVGEILAMMATKPVTLEQRIAFMNALRKQMKDNQDRWFTLSVDYGPCTMLREAAEESGVSIDNFPWKTMMIFDKGKVIASLGYHGEQVEL